MSGATNSMGVEFDSGAIVPFSNKGIWIFVGIDMTIFSLFFLIFLIEKHNDKDVFSESQLLLNSSYGFVNTLILITSSWLLVKSLRAMLENAAYARVLLGGSILCGVTFVVLKLFEYSEKFSAGISVVENSYFTFYYLLTFLHLCHVVGGLIALSIIFSGLKKGADIRLVSSCESVGIYWHMVDLLWIYLFLVLYLLP